MLCAFRLNNTIYRPIGRDGRSISKSWSASVVEHCKGAIPPFHQPGPDMQTDAYRGPRWEAGVCSSDTDPAMRLLLFPV